MSETLRSAREHKTGDGDQMVWNWADGKRRVEVFVTRGCPACEPTVALVRQLAHGECEVVVHDVHTSGVDRARGYGVNAFPAVVVDGRLAQCCETSGPCSGDVEALRAAITGTESQLTQGRDGRYEFR